MNHPPRGRGGSPLSAFSSRHGGDHASGAERGSSTHIEWADADGDLLLSHQPSGRVLICRGCLTGTENFGRGTARLVIEVGRDRFAMHDRPAADVADALRTRAFKELSELVILHRVDFDAFVLSTLGAPRIDA